MSEQTQWEPVAGAGAPFFKFKTVGDTISGKIVGKRQMAGLEGKPQDVIDLVTKDGEFTVGLTADLKNKIGKLEMGRLVRIKFTGTKKITGKPSPMKTFEVLVAQA
jgi:hypothetical protein